MRHYFLVVHLPIKSPPPSLPLLSPIPPRGVNREGAIGLTPLRSNLESPSIDHA